MAGMSKYRKIAVLMGGPSSEREVSIRSGKAVAGGLKAAGYEVTEVDVTGHRVDVPEGTEAVFIALHGEFGEDGGVQALLDEMGIPYAGSGAESSRCSFDKVLTRNILEKAGIPVPRGEVVKSLGRSSISLPVVVKPPCQGSSIGISRVINEDEWEPALNEAFLYSEEVLVEEYIKGRELTVGVVEKESLPLVEIVAPDDWYNYNAKYTKGETRYIVPAPVSEEVNRACRETALKTFEVLDCSGFARVDFRLAEDGSIYVLELNSIPGFTETSLLPKAAAEAGMSFSELCNRIMMTVI